jgi:peptide deformylase
MSVELSTLRILHYPDPRLRTPCQTVTDFSPQLAALAARMLEMMKAAKGVGLAAPQVGAMLRMFVMNTTPEPENARIYVNPVIRNPAGTTEAEEGCLSIPNVNAQIRRASRCTLTAQDLQGRTVELEGADLTARVWQHETDHLNGVLILDRMGPGDKIAARKALKSLEDAFKNR